MIAHSILHSLSDSNSVQRAVRLKGAKCIGDGLSDESLLGA